MENCDLDGHDSRFVGKGELLRQPMSWIALWYTVFMGHDPQGCAQMPAVLNRALQAVAGPWVMLSIEL